MITIAIIITIVIALLIFLIGRTGKNDHVPSLLDSYDKNSCS